MILNRVLQDLTGKVTPEQIQKGCRHKPAALCGEEPSRKQKLQVARALRQTLVSSRNNKEKRMGKWLEMRS